MISSASDLYRRSISEKYKKYFTQAEDIYNTYARYSMIDQTCHSSSASKQWENGVAGVPILWTPSTKTVYIDSTDTHTLVVGPTGSKKSRLIAMPLVRILGSAKENMIISDPKSEIYSRTATYLHNQGYNIYVLNLRNPSSGDSWNPLAIPYRYYLSGNVDKAYEFINDISENLTHNTNSSGDPFWENSAATLFFGLTVLLFKYCKEKNLSDEYVTISNIDALRHQLLSQSPREARDNPSILWRYAKEDPIVAANLVGTIETAEDTRGGIVSVFSQMLRIFSIQPNLMDMLSNSSVDLDHMEDTPTAIFMILPDEKTGYHGIGSLFIKQSYEYLIYLAQKDHYQNGKIASLKRRVNYIVDEFASLPTINDFPALITAARSRNIRFILLVQSKHQLIQRYKEEADTIMTNCSNWIILTSREQSFLEELSALSGKTSTTPQLSVIPPETIQRLDKDTGEALIFLARKRPLISHIPDIEKYDDNHYEYLPIVKRNPLAVEPLHFFEEEEMREREEKEKKRKEQFDRLRFFQENSVNDDN